MKIIYTLDNKHEIFTITVEEGIVTQSTSKKKRINAYLVGDTEEFFLNWLDGTELRKHFQKTIIDG